MKNPEENIMDEEKPKTKRKRSKLNFKSLENELGTMYHLLLDRPTEAPDSIKYVSDKDHPKFAGVNGNPVFFNWDKEFRIATDYTIVYPKVYVKESVPYDVKTLITRAYIQ